MFKKVYDHLKSNPQYFIYFYFFVLAGFIAYSVGDFILPDETVHYTAIEFYSRYSPSPITGNQTDSFIAGEVVRTGSYFYYYLLGFFYNIVNLFGFQPLVFIRLVNVLLGVGTLAILFKIAIHFKIENKMKLAIIFLIANIPMFVVVSSGVNYDGLTIFLSVALTYTILLLSEKITLYRSAIAIIIMAIGPIVKLAFAPISVAALIACLFLFYTRKRTAKKKQKKATLKEKVLLIFSAVVVLLSIGLFFERYGRNYLEYESLQPRCNQVLTEQECSNNAVYKRNKIYEEAQLPHPEINYINYGSEWVQLMSERTFGLLVHKPFNHSYTVIYIGLYLSFITVVIFIRKVKYKREYIFIILSTFLYLLALLITNIGVFNKTQEIDLAVQGRYLFPVSFAFVVLVLHLNNKNFIKVSKTASYYLLISFLVMLAIMMGPVNLLSGTNETWIRSDREAIRNLLYR